MFVWLLTGFGKSLCYQALPFMMEHKMGQLGGCAMLVVVRLVALLINQVGSKLFGLLSEDGCASHWDL